MNITDNKVFNALTSRKSVDLSKYIPSAKMAYLYSPIDNRQILLDAVSNVTYNVTGNPTQSPVESGKSIVDNYIIQPRTASFTGIIADTKVNKEDSISVQEYIEAVEKLVELKEPFTFYCDDLLMPNIQNCLISNFSLSRDQDIGIGVAVAVTVQEVLIIERAKPTSINVKEKNTGTNAKSVEDKPNNSKGDGTTKEPPPFYLQRAQSAMSSAIKSPQNKQQQ